jgi:hypothetical protein
MKKKFQWWQVASRLDERDPSDIEWCITTFGPEDPNGRWMFESSSQCFYFIQHKDAMWYELMWAGERVEQ